ncbi:MAG: hypothetical protein HKP27_16975 [Myxococcales bacterium]|nr:hypothetical protein [Myxococcales bacterium]
MIKRSTRNGLIVLALILLCALSGRSVEPKTQQAIGVVPFRVTAPPGATVPEVAAQLVQRLATLGVPRAVLIEGAPSAALIAGDAAALAEAGRVSETDVVLLGKTTKLGNRLSFDGELRSAATGARIGKPFFVESPDAGDGQVGPVVDALAKRALAQLRPMKAARQSPDAVSEDDGGSSLLPSVGNADAPVSIKSDGLEAVEQGGKRHLRFVGNVRVVQGEMKLHCDEAEAFYPPGGSQPDRLVATGNVVIKSDSRVARCDEATFVRADDLVVCSRNARVDDGCDRITADEIHFNTRKETFSARKNVQVQMNRDAPGCEKPS